MWHMLGHFLWVLFQWPQGIVVGNLIANMIWEWPSQLIHLIRTHKQNNKQTEHIKTHINSTVTSEQARL